MHPRRITESLSVLRQKPPALRRPSRLTYGIAAATVAAAAVTAVAVGGVAGGPVTAASAGHAGTTAAFSHLHGVHESPAAVSAQRVSNSASGTHLAVVPKGTSQPDQTTAKQAPAQQAAPQQSAAPQAPAQPAWPSQPYEFYDSTIPSAIPYGSPAAVYSDGPYFATSWQLGNLGSTLWIDVTGQNPNGASVLDVEPSDATPQQAATWVWNRVNANHHAIARIYTMLGEWPAVQAAIGTLPGWVQAQVRWWIADPNGIPHIVPGAQATQWYWGPGYDESLALPSF